MQGYTKLEHSLAKAYADLGWSGTADESATSSESAPPGRLPIVYSPSYNIALCGLEHFHAFDAKKFAKILKLLTEQCLLRPEQLWAAVEASEEQLRDVHSPEYIRALYTSSKAVAEVVELPAVAYLPNWLVQSRLARPWRYHAGGTMLAAGLALQHGWSINIGGGMHHASFDSGSGWCAYDDLHLALRQLRRATSGSLQKCLLVDLDVHQGNGHERDKLRLKDGDLHILDVYGADLWPGDTFAKAAIDIDVGIPLGTADDAYLLALEGALQRAKAEFNPDVILYNAGTDILVGDPLGHMAVSAAGVRERDEMVWRFARDARTPICMVLSGGYAKDNWRVVGDSLANLLRTFNLVDGGGALSLWQSM